MHACVQLSYSEKGLRKIMDQTKLYQSALSEPAVLQGFQVCPRCAGCDSRRLMDGCMHAWQSCAPAWAI